MTYAACIVVPKAIVIAEDTRVWTMDAHGGDRKPEEESKLIEVRGRFGVASFGTGPLGDHVPSAVKGIDPGTSGTWVLAAKILKRFWHHDPLPLMSFFVAGWDNRRPNLLKVSVRAQRIESLNRNADGSPVLGVYTSDNSIDVHTVLGRLEGRLASMSTRDAIACARKLVEAAMTANPDYVGGQTEILVVGPHGTRWENRLPGATPGS